MGEDPGRDVHAAGENEVEGASNTSRGADFGMKPLAPSSSARATLSRSCRPESTTTDVAEARSFVADAIARGRTPGTGFPG